jgi:hypothetical protein
MYPTDKEEEMDREECGGWGRGEGSYVVCTTLFMWLPKTEMLVVGGGMDDEGMGKQRSKRLDATKDNREHVLACQSKTDAELSVMKSLDETRGRGFGCLWPEGDW